MLVSWTLKNSIKALDEILHRGESELKQEIVLWFSYPIYFSLKSTSSVRRGEMISASLGTSACLVQEAERMKAEVCSGI